MAQEKDRLAPTWAETIELTTEAKSGSRPALRHGIFMSLPLGFLLG